MILKFCQICLEIKKPQALCIEAFGINSLSLIFYINANHHKQ